MVSDNQLKIIELGEKALKITQIQQTLKYVKNGDVIEEILKNIKDEIGKTIIELNNESTSKTNTKKTTR